MNSSISKTLKPIGLISLFALCTGLSSASLAATIEFVGVGKGIDNVQTSSVDVQVNPTPQSPSYGGAYSFHANVEGQNISSISAPVVTGPMSPPSSWLNGGTLVYNTANNAWRMGLPYGNDWGSPTMADLNAKFGSGVYTFNINGTSIPLNLTGDAYPNTPIVTLGGGFWSGGKYVIDVSHDLTITTNAFAAYGTHVEDHIGLGVGGFWAEQFHSTTPGASFLSMTIPAFSLVSGQDYGGHAGFAAVVDLNSNAALPNSLNAAFYEVNTSFVISTVSAVPVPAAAWLFGSGLIGLAGIARKRKVA